MASYNNSTTSSPAGVSLFDELHAILRRMEAGLAAHVAAVVQQQTQQLLSINLDDLAERLVPRLVPLLRSELVTVKKTP